MADHIAIKESSVKTDALVRAARTFYTAVGVDILALIGVGLTDLLNSGTPVTAGAFWGLAGVLIVKSVLTGVATYLLRLKVTPRNELDTVDVSA